MACGVCRSGGVPVKNTGRTVAPQTNAYGILPLQAYPDCNTPYIGRFKAGSVYVVGYDTEHEKVFKKTDRNAALAYQNEAQPGTKLNMFQVPVTQICVQAGLDLFGS